MLSKYRTFSDLCYNMTQYVVTIIPKIHLVVMLAALRTEFDSNLNDSNIIRRQADIALWAWFPCEKWHLLVQNTNSTRNNTEENLEIKKQILHSNKRRQERKQALHAKFKVVSLTQ